MSGHVRRASFVIRFSIYNLRYMHFEGLLIGACTFLIIGLFHPLVIKMEYYWGTKLWWTWLLAGIIGLVISLVIDNITVSAILGSFSFSAFWGIGDLFAQEKRVQKGWFPRNPKRKYKWDEDDKDNL